MSAITPTIVRLSDTHMRLTWGPVTESDTCVASGDVCKHPDRSVQVKGTFGGASVGISGSNDGGTTFDPLTDPQGVTIGITSEGIKGITEFTEQLKPVLTGGSGASLTIVMIARG